MITSDAIFKTVSTDGYTLYFSATQFKITYGNGNATISFNSIQNRWVGRIKFIDGTIQWFKAPVNGRNDITIPRVGALVLDLDTLEMKVIEDREADFSSRYLYMYYSANNTPDDAFGVIKKLTDQRRFENVNKKVQSHIEFVSGISDFYLNGETSVIKFNTKILDKYIARIWYPLDVYDSSSSYSWIEGELEYQIPRT